MSQQDLGSRFRAARDSQNDGNNGPFLDLLDSEVVWWDTGIEVPLVGREAVAQRLTEIAVFRIHEHIHDLFLNSEHLVALVHAEAQGDEGTFIYSTAEVYHFADNGLFSKRQAFAHVTTGIADFFRRP
jgi:hypothetical protein